jgi:hypothetical protein
MQFPPVINNPYIYSLDLGKILHEDTQRDILLYYYG